MLVEHRARRLRTLLGEIAAVLAAPFEGLDALPVVAGKVRHDVPGVELVGALRRLPVGDVVRLLQVDADIPLLVVATPEHRDGVVRRADHSELVLTGPTRRATPRRPVPR